MKKLMIAVAIVCAAAMSQAATYNWQAKAGWVSEKEADVNPSWKGTAVYFFDTQTVSTEDFITALSGENAKDIFDSALGHGNVKSGGSFSFSDGTSTGHGITSYMDESIEKVRGYAVILDGIDLDSAKNAYIFEYDAVNIEDAQKGGSNAVFNQSELYTGAVGGAGWYQIVPEPTSGLLLLIGVAGLALRRRRA